MHSFSQIPFLLTIMIAAGNAPAIVINEFMASNGNTISAADGEYHDWIELYNNTDEAVNLEGWFLSDTDNNPTRWQFPPVIIEPSGFLLVWASGLDHQDGVELHTDFRISSSGEPLLLVAPDGETIHDRIEATELGRDISLGRAPDGSSQLRFFKDPTPGAANSDEGYLGILPQPTLSVAPGIYSEEQELEIFHSRPGVRLFYTIDGTVPDATSPEYTGPILLGDRSDDENDISLIRTNLIQEPDVLAHRDPEGKITKGTTLRVSAHHLDYIMSDPVTASYFIFPEGVDRYHIPIISMTTDPDNFFGHERGIYVAGINGEEDNFWVGNYTERGIDWERPISMELFNLDGGLEFQQDLGARIHGGYSRRMPQKTLRLYARNRYGNDTVNYPLFPNREDTHYRRFLLRNSGNDWVETHIRDATVHQVVAHMGFATQDYQPVIMFLNGEYWGIHNMRERMDAHYLARRKGVDPDEVDILTWHRDVKQGEATHYQALLDFLDEEDLSIPENMAHVRTMMDVENFLNYYIAQIYHGNRDWPHNNIDYWRLRVPHDPAMPPGHDGRWRWLHYDVDQSYGFVRGHTFNAIAWVTSRLNGIYNNVWPNRVLRALLQNPDFEIQFINTMADHLNTTFTTDRVRGFIDEIAGNMEPLMPEHLARWRPQHSMNNWNSYVAKMYNFANGRPNSMRTHIRNHFGISGNINLTVSTNHGLDAGRIRVNSILIDGNTPGVPEDPTEWTGVYFAGVPLPITAIPADGYRFVEWRSVSGETEDVLSTSRQFQLDADEHIHVMAIFEEADTNHPIHYWSFNNPDHPMEPVYTAGWGRLDFSLTDESELLMEKGSGFRGTNSIFDFPAGNHLRFNNPMGSELTLRIPTSGFEAVTVSYETRRSGQGPGTQRIAYSIDGTTFHYFTSREVRNDTPEVVKLDFRDLPAADNNQNFSLRIYFEENGGGQAGNHRFDNLVVSGYKHDTTPSPPAPHHSIPDVIMVAGGEPKLLPRDYPHEASGQGNLSLLAGFPHLVSSEVASENIRLTPLAQGESTITATRTFPSGAQSSSYFRVFTYPAPHPLVESPCYMTEWDAGRSEMSFPHSMIFLQSAMSDPGLTAPLPFAYRIPREDIHPDDLDSSAFPYALTRRTRINALGTGGISFINTGRGRDVGGALLAIDTRGVSRPTVSWDAGTIQQNERLYGLTLQYRLGIEGDFITLPTTTYIAGQDGDLQAFGPIDLPEEAREHPNVQLLWRYHHVEGSSGPRSEIRLDNIRVGDPAHFRVGWYLY
ncbi:MAG: CotH kinase family protein [Candidatus Sumerlaeia bacterium]|nr:CotH kinase family protein [Candidatus Sumerlaeia bacterium]